MAYRMLRHQDGRVALHRVTDNNSGRRGYGPASFSAEPDVEDPAGTIIAEVEAALHDIKTYGILQINDREQVPAASEDLPAVTVTEVAEVTAPADDDSDRVELDRGEEDVQ